MFRNPRRWGSRRWRGRRSGGGCGGCGCLLLMLLFAVAWVFLVQLRAPAERWLASPSVPGAVQTVISDLIRLGAQLRDSLLRLVGG